MQKPNSKWISFLSAGIFLLMILMQPIHQIGHLLEHHEHDASEVQDNSLSLTSSEIPCELCDFNFAHPVEIEFQEFDFSITIKTVFSPILEKIPSKITSRNPGSFHLRGPPKIA
jgi:hypothetical protein